ncbi:Dead deah box rna, partial [Globisporangium splendens]
MRRQICSLVRAAALLLLMLLHSTAAVASDGVSDIRARDGFGQPVAWWAVLKLPMHVHDDSASFSKVRATPCDCAPPACENAPTASLNVTDRATGLCYLYADASRPFFQHFRSLGYDCLGQGGKDPLSHTLRQMKRSGVNTNSEEPSSPYWAIFNDQLNGIARDYRPPDGTRQSPSSGICSGGDVFSAHAKGALAFEATTGGFFMQTSTPNFPDPTLPTTDSEDSGAFVALGCQVNNNVQYAQHMLAMSLGMDQLRLLGSNLQTARLCSGNFYRSKNESTDLHELLASKNLYDDGVNTSVNSNLTELYDALLNPSLPEREQSAAFTLTLQQLPTSSAAPSQRKSAVFVPFLDEKEPSLAELNSALQAHEAAQPQIVEVIVKTPKEAVPPWAIVAETLQSDISVASWWDSGYGIPNVCAGDDFTSTPSQFCLPKDDDNSHNEHILTRNGTAKYNIENLIEATWEFDGTNESLTWHLVGGSERDGNHGILNAYRQLLFLSKWGLTTPRFGQVDARNAYVTFADLNMEGFPCSKSCSGSQAGRGGSFFSLLQLTLHASVTQKIVSKACRCAALTDNKVAKGPPQFEDARMCRFGCWRKVQQRFQPDELPHLAPNATSFWTN